MKSKRKESIGVKAFAITKLTTKPHRLCLPAIILPANKLGMMHQLTDHRMCYMKSRNAPEQTHSNNRKPYFELYQLGLCWLVYLVDELVLKAQTV